MRVPGSTAATVLLLYLLLWLFSILLSLMPFMERHRNDHEEQLENLSFTLRPLPDYLPCRCNIDGGRTQIIIRPLRRDEVGHFYAAMKEAAETGNGYGFDELPGLAYFVRWYVDDLYNLVFELPTPEAKEQTAVIGYTNFGPSVYTRSRIHPALFDGNIVLRPEFRVRGWFHDLTEIRKGIVVDHGIRGFFEDSAVINVQATRTMRRSGALVCGCIPRYVYIRHHGFIDGVLYYKPLDQTHSFKLNNTTMLSKI